MPAHPLSPQPLISARFPDLAISLEKPTLLGWMLQKGLTNRWILRSLAVVTGVAILLASSAALALKRGDRGPSVSRIQTGLRALGYFNASVTGYYGSATEAAVKRFQAAKGLTADGIVGTRTLAVLNDSLGGSGNPSAPQGGLRLGSRGIGVARVQETLKNLGYYTGVADGNFGTQTESAVKRFQAARGLTVDGIVGTSTLNALNTAQVDDGGGSETPSTVLKRGSRGVEVSNLQNDLRTLGFFSNSTTGYFGSVTEAAVIRFQKSAGIQANGMVGPTTQAAIERALGSGGGTSPPTSTGVLRRGSRSQAVYDLQRDLTALKYYNGPVTGYYGPQTETAVARFQQSVGIRMDGVAGSNTLAAIDRALGSGGGTSPAAVLKRGSRGSAVTDLQQDLKRLNFYSGPVTGYYGTQTEAAVIRFQRAVGIRPDGVAGAATLSSISSQLAMAL